MIAAETVNVLPSAFVSDLPQISVNYLNSTSSSYIGVVTVIGAVTVDRLAIVSLL